MVVRDGDFLVRESQASPGQYVLTGMQGGSRKHLLLVDPEGVVSVLCLIWQIIITNKQISSSERSENNEFC